MTYWGRSMKMSASSTKKLMKKSTSRRRARAEPIVVPQRHVLQDSEKEGLKDALLGNQS
jgi:hypothetical protein